MEERLQKILARAGYGSRRACEALIEAGRVRVNNQTANLGDKADPVQDRIQVDGQLIKAAEALVYIALYKPRGVISAVVSPDPRPTVRDLVEIPENIYPVGRLDVDSEGLILLTNDGELANRLTHPRYEHEKEYRVLVARRPDEEQLNTWRRGVVLEDGYRTQPAQVEMRVTAGKGAWLRVILREGRKRQIRETGSLLGLPVVKIIRVRMGPIELGTLKPREWRRLTMEEIAMLKGDLPSPEKRRRGDLPTKGKPLAKRGSHTGDPPARKPGPPGSRGRSGPRAETRTARKPASRVGGRSSDRDQSQSSGPPKGGPRTSGPYKGGSQKSGGPGRSGPPKSGQSRRPPKPRARK